MFTSIIAIRKPFSHSKALQFMYVTTQTMTSIDTVWLLTIFQITLKKDLMFIVRGNGDCLYNTYKLEYID